MPPTADTVPRRQPAGGERAPGGTPDGTTGDPADVARDPAGDSPGEPAWRRSEWRRRVLRLSLRPLGIYVASRLGVLMVAGATAHNEHLSMGQVLIVWDGNWYLQNAEHGYATVVPAAHTPSAMGFFPLLPMIVRLVHSVGWFTFGQAGLLVTFAAGLTAAVAVWWLIHEFAGVRGADRGTALVFLSPGAFVLSLVYSEGLLITLSACALFALGRRRWLLAGVFAGLATATDPVASAIVIACAVASIQAIRARREWRSLVAPLLAPVGILGFFVFLWVRTGTPFAWFLAQRRGFQDGAYFYGVPRSFLTVFHHGFGELNSLVKMTSFLVAVVLVVVFLRARPPAAWTGFVFAVLAMGMFSPIIGITPRLLLRGFPLLGVVGAKLEHGWFEVVIGLSALTMAALAVLALGSPGFTP